MSNALLRAHLTRVGFDLSLGRSHVAALVRLDKGIRTRKYLRLPKGVRDLFPYPVHGLVARGLVVHHYDERDKKHDKGYAPHYSITPAGQLVVGLLKESGLYDEYASELVVR